jgi:hypothetical protein
VIWELPLNKAIIGKKKYQTHCSEVEGNMGNQARQTLLTSGPWISVAGVDREVQVLWCLFCTSFWCLLSTSHTSKARTQNITKHFSWFVDLFICTTSLNNNYYCAEGYTLANRDTSQDLGNKVGLYELPSKVQAYLSPLSTCSGDKGLSLCNWQAWRHLNLLQGNLREQDQNEMETKTVPCAAPRWPCN